MEKYVLFIGIDISKKWIDVALTPDGQKEQMHHQRFSNNLKGFKKMMSWILKFIRQQNLAARFLFCMEHTGVETVPGGYFLQEQDFDYVLDSALRIKRSLGLKRGKDDKADSKDIARYIYMHHKGLKASILPAKVLMDLKNLLAYRDRLVKKRQAIKVAARETKAFMPDDSIMSWIMDASAHIISLLKSKIKNWGFFYLKI